MLVTGGVSQSNSTVLAEKNNVCSCVQVSAKKRGAVVLEAESDLTLVLTSSVPDLMTR